MMTNRWIRIPASALLLGAVLLAAACGDDETGDGTDAASGAGEAATEEPSEDGGASSFPVTIEHKFGSTEIAKEPERVLSLGFQEHDAIFALGVEPIAVRYWFGDEEDVIFPWAEDEAGDADPEILNMTSGELSFEKIAALDPDLILGVYSGITDQEYETLSEIAPTVAQSDDYVDFGVPWQDMTLTVGQALGRQARAEELVADLEDQFAAARDENPGFEGQSVVVATYDPAEIGFFASEDTRSRFFTSLGFDVPAELDDLTGDLFFGTISREQVGLLDTDLLVWDQMQYVEGGPATVKADPLIEQLEVMRQDRAIFLEGDVENAFAFNTVLSLPFVLDEVVPELAEAVGPSAEPEPAP